MIGWIIHKLVGTKNEREIKRLRGEVEKINAMYEELVRANTSEEDLQRWTEEIKNTLKGKDVEETFEFLDGIIHEAFARVKYACKLLLGKTWEVTGIPTEWNMVPYDVQLMGAIALHEGKIAEMATGEGKTLVATLPLYLNALSGRGVHLITVNDYLARRDREWMGKLYETLGLTVGVIQQGMEPSERRKQYLCDVTYGTNSEFGFDYLRDNMAVSVEQRVQRGHFYAIVDEVDSILIDEARTPLIISGPVEQSQQSFEELNPCLLYTSPSPRD